MRDNASKLYIHGSGSRMLAASTIRVAITEFYRYKRSCFLLLLLFIVSIYSFLFLFPLSAFSYSRLISVYILFQLRRIDVPLVASLSISVCCSTTSLQKSLIIGEASKCYTCKLYLQIFLDAITSARSPSARVHDPFSLVAHYISARPYYVTT